jgi:hypothetical protein
MYEATGNMNNVAALSEAELAIELAGAKARLKWARENRIPQSSDFYYMAKTGIRIFSDETRARSLVGV